MLLVVYTAEPYWQRCDVVYSHVYDSYYGPGQSANARVGWRPWSSGRGKRGPRIPKSNRFRNSGRVGRGNRGPTRAMRMASAELPRARRSAQVSRDRPALKTRLATLRSIQRRGAKRDAEPTAPRVSLPTRPATFRTGSLASVLCAIMELAKKFWPMSSPLSRFTWKP